MPDLSWANRQVSRGCPHQALTELLEDDEKFGFIVMDGLGCLYGTLSGNTREVLHRFTVGNESADKQDLL